MGPNDSSSLRLSQRSNGLAFSQHHFFSSSYGAVPSAGAAKKPHVPALQPRTSNPSAGPRAPPQEENHQLDDVDENSGNVVALRKVASLIPPSVRQPPNTKVETKALCSPGYFRRSISSAASVRSFSSSLRCRKRKITPAPTLDSLPSEIQDQIFAGLPQKTLHNLMLTSTAFLEAAAIALYSNPKFATTYRFAQFVTTVVHSRHYAEMVRILCLADFGTPSELDIPLAGWREWKYRTELLYSIPRPGDVNRGFTSAKYESRPTDLSLDTYSSHPKSSPFLKQYSTIQDVPVGAIVHVLKACPKLKHVDLSTVSISPDYAIKSPLYIPSSFTSLIFVSDVPKSWTWKGGELKQVYTADIVQSLTFLPDLLSLRVKKACWLSSQDVETIVNNCPRLEHVDFRESGMKQNMHWARKGRKAGIAELLAVTQAATALPPQLSTY